jgi:hypothetical protein
MSLLQIANDPHHEHDASSEGKDLAAGSSNLLWTTIAAVILVSAGIAAFLYINHKPPVAAGEVTQVSAHSVHSLGAGVSGNGIAMSAEPSDQVLVFATVRVRNQSDQPFVLKEFMTNATFADGIHSSYAAGAADFERIFAAYPELAGLRGKPLLRETVVPAGQSVDGVIISSFHATKELWATKKDLNFTITLKMHPDLVLTPTGPITEQ